MDIVLLFLFVALLGCIIAQQVAISKKNSKIGYLNFEKEGLKEKASKFEKLHEDNFKECAILKKVNGTLQSENSKLKNLHSKRHK